MELQSFEPLMPALVVRGLAMLRTNVTARLGEVN